MGAVVKCIACGEPAFHRDAEGIPLCDGDYAHLMHKWACEDFTEINRRMKEIGVEDNAPGEDCLTQ